MEEPAGGGGVTNSGPGGGVDGGRGHQLFVCGRQLAPQPAQSTISPVLFRFRTKIRLLSWHEP